GVHTVTSTALATNGSFLFDSSPLFTPEKALADMGPGKLLAPGSVYDLDTSSLALGNYTVFCKIHPGMQGNVTITLGPPGMGSIVGRHDGDCARRPANVPRCRKRGRRRCSGPLLGCRRDLDHRPNHRRVRRGSWQGAGPVASESVVPETREQRIEKRAA